MSNLGKGTNNAGSNGMSCLDASRVRSNCTVDACTSSSIEKSPSERWQSTSNSLPMAFSIPSKRFVATSTFSWIAATESLIDAN